MKNFCGGAIFGWLSGLVVFIGMFLYVGHDFDRDPNEGIWSTVQVRKNSKTGDYTIDVSCMEKLKVGITEDPVPNITTTVDADGKVSLDVQLNAQTTITGAWLECEGDALPITYDLFTDETGQTWKRIFRSIDVKKFEEERHSSPPLRRFLFADKIFVENGIVLCQELDQRNGVRTCWMLISK